MQEPRRIKEETEKENGGEKYENEESTRRPEISEGHTRICGENRKV